MDVDNQPEGETQLDLAAPQRPSPEQWDEFENVVRNAISDFTAKIQDGAVSDLDEADYVTLKNGDVVIMGAAFQRLQDEIENSAETLDLALKDLQWEVEHAFRALRDLRRAAR